MDQTAAATRTQYFTATYPADPEQVRHARRAVAELLGDSLAAADAALIASELAANAVLHSASADGGTFTLRARITGRFARIEVCDAGGPWNRHPHHDSRSHGLDLIEAITGSGNWGITGDTSGRTAWARIILPAMGNTHEHGVRPPGHPALTAGQPRFAEPS